MPTLPYAAAGGGAGPVLPFSWPPGPPLSPAAGGKGWGERGHFISSLMPPYEEGQARVSCSHAPQAFSPQCCCQRGQDLLSHSQDCGTCSRWQGVGNTEQGGGYLFLACAISPVLEYSGSAYLHPHQQGQLYLAAPGRCRTSSPEQCSWWGAWPVLPSAADSGAQDQVCTALSSLIPVAAGATDQHRLRL